MIPRDTPAGMNNCGIAVVAMLAGVTYTDALMRFIRLCGTAELSTVWDRQRVLESFGLTVQEEVHYRIKPTLTQWINNQYDPTFDYHLTLTGHAIAVRKHMLFDQRYTNGISALRSPYKRKRVMSYHNLGETR